MTLTLDSKVPGGPIADMWENYKFDLKLVNPANRRKFEVIVVGTGLAGGAAAAASGAWPAASRAMAICACSACAAGPLPTRIRRARG